MTKTTRRRWAVYVGHLGIADRNYCTKLVGLLIGLANADEIRYAGRVRRVVRLPEDVEHSALVGISRSYDLLVSLLGNNWRS